MQAAAIGLIIERRILDAAARSALLIAEMPHCGEEKRKAATMLRDVARFLAHLHLQNSILFRIEAVERCRTRVELVAQHNDQISQRHDEPLSRSMVLTRAVADRSRWGMA